MPRGRRGGPIPVGRDSPRDGSVASREWAAARDAPVSTFVASLVAVMTLSAAGSVPTVAVAGRRWVAAPLAPLTGAVLAALAAVCVLVVGGPVLGWFVVLAVVAAGAVAAWRWWLGGHLAMSQAPSPAGKWATRWGAVALAVTGAWSLLPLRAPTVGFDARSTWLLHAVWFSDGHLTAIDALRNPALSFAHTAYPPLIGGAVAVVWAVTGDRSYTLGVVVVAFLNVAALLAAATVLVEVGRRCGDAVAAHHVRPPGESTARRAPALEAAHVAGVVAAALAVLVTAGVAGQFLTDGYADVLWSAAAVGAVGFGLVLPGTGQDLGACVLLLAVAGLTKNEGTASAVAIALLLTARALWRTRSSGRGFVGAWRPLLFGVLGVVALCAWPVLARLLGAAPDVAVAGKRVGNDLNRLHLTVDAMRPHLHVLFAAVPVAVLGAVVLRRARAAARLGNDGWAWAALACGLVAVAADYVGGSGTLAFWLDTSVHRTTLFPVLMAWWILAAWGIVATAQGAVPADPFALDDPLLPVLHHPV